MSNSGSESEFSNEEQGALTFSIQAYQFEMRVNTDKRDITTYIVVMDMVVTECLYS